VRLQQRLGQPIGHADTGKLLTALSRASRAARAGPLGIDDGYGIGNPLTRLVMVRDHHVEANALGGRNLLPGADAAVHGDDQAHALRRETPQSADVETVTLLYAVRNVGPHTAAQCLQRLHQERRRSHAVGIEITEDGDLLTAFQSPDDALDSPIHIGQREGICAVFLAIEESRGAVGFCDPAIVENLHHQRVKIRKTGEMIRRCGAGDLPALVE